MYNPIKQVLQFTLFSLITTLFLTSCGTDNAHTRYIAAKLVDSDMWSIIDVKNGEILHKDEFKSQPSIIVNDKFCVKNESGLYDYFSVNNVTKPINSESYLCATAFNEHDVALAVLKGKVISIIDGNCNVIANLDNSIVSADNFSNGYAIVSNDDNKYGYIDEKGEVIIKPSYDTAYPFSKEGLSIVGKKVNDSTTKYFAINAQGEELFSFSSNEYKDFGSFIDGYLPVQKENDEVILLDKTGKKSCSIGKWDGYIPSWLGFNNATIVFKDGDAFGLKNKKGEIIIRAKYDELVPLTNINSKYYLAKKQGLYGIIDDDDTVIIPFDYSILGYLDKNVLFVGENKSFSLMDNNLKDISQTNFTNLSFWNGTPIYSNYFNANKEAQKIISNITDSTFYNTHKGMSLRDFRHLLSGNRYADMAESLIYDVDYPITFIYGFNQKLSSQRYEYIYGYRFPTTPEYNYNAELTIVIAAINNTVKQFQPGSEEELAKAFDSQIQKIGFKPVAENAHWFKNDKDIAVALDYYEDGGVSVICVYDQRNKYIDITRLPRKDSHNNDIQVDYIDTFGLEKDADSMNFIRKLKASDPDIKTTASGLSYKIIYRGENPLIEDNSIVKVNYVGKLVDGTVFDQNPDGDTATFSPNGVIPGFSEGLKMLGKGGKAVFYIPGKLAYGSEGVPQAGIGPNAMLIFDVEIIDIKNS